MYLEPRREYCLLMRFDDYTEDRMPYMYHCHLLLHEDEGLMGRFLVVDGDADRNDRDRTPPGPYHSQSHDE